MPNYCKNVITLIGDEETISRLREAIIAEYENSALHIHGGENGKPFYGIFDMGYPNEFDFTTKWGPDVDFTEEASKKFPEITIKHEWDTQGGGERGFSVVKNGKLLEQCLEYIGFDAETGEPGAVIERLYYNYGA